MNPPFIVNQEFLLSWIKISFYRESRSPFIVNQDLLLSWIKSSFYRESRVPFIVNKFINYSCNKRVHLKVKTTKNLFILYPVLRPVSCAVLRPISCFASYTLFCVLYPFYLICLLCCYGYNLGCYIQYASFICFFI